MAGVKGKSGGARPGAGRKPSPVKRAAVSIYLTPDEREALALCKARGIDIHAALGTFINNLAEASE